MAFRLDRFLQPFLLFLVVTIVIFISFPIETPTTNKIYNYETHSDQFSNTINYTPIFLEVLAVLGFFLWYATLQDKEFAIMRNLDAVLKDPNCHNFEVEHGIYAPFITPHDHPIGDFPEGSLGIGMVKNNRNEDVYVLYHRDSDYATTDTRSKTNTPILGHSIIPAHIEDAERILRPSLRRTEVKIIEDFLRRTRSMSPEKEEYLKSIAERKFKEEETEGEDER